MSNDTSSLHIQRGTCLALFAYDVGLSIDLEASRTSLAGRAAEQRESIRRTRPAPSYFEFKPAPLRVTQSGTSIPIATSQTNANVDIVLYDFGAVSVAYSIPLAGSLDDLLRLAEALYDNKPLLDDSRAHVARLVRELGGAIRNPDLASFVEDYAIFQIHEHAAPGSTDEPTVTSLPSWVDANSRKLANILRSERAELSTQEVSDAMSCRISYGQNDAALIDWNAALLFDADPADATAALEFANVELLEMRHLDDRLDTSMEEIYRTILGRAPRAAAGDAMERISTLQIDSALLFEGVNNALKLLGDQYLARVYRLAAQRFHLPEWDQSILRKLATLDGIYQKLSDRRTNRRMESLEWIIIALIAFEIVYSLLKG